MPSSGSILLLYIEQPLRPSRLSIKYSVSGMICIEFMWSITNSAIQAGDWISKREESLVLLATGLSWSCLKRCLSEAISWFNITPDNYICTFESISESGSVFKIDKKVHACCVYMHVCACAIEIDHTIAQYIILISFNQYNFHLQISTTRWCSGVRLDGVLDRYVCAHACVWAQEKLSKHPSQLSQHISADQGAGWFPGPILPAVTCSWPP